MLMICQSGSTLKERLELLLNRLPLPKQRNRKKEKRLPCNIRLKFLQAHPLLLKSYDLFPLVIDKMELLNNHLTINPWSPKDINLHTHIETLSNCKHHPQPSQGLSFQTRYIVQYSKYMLCMGLIKYLRASPPSICRLDNVASTTVQRNGIAQKLSPMAVFKY